MAVQLQIPALIGSLTDAKDGSFTDWRIGLFTNNDYTPGVRIDDETGFIEPTWSGYSKQNPNPWGLVTSPEDSDYAKVNTALLQFDVESDPGSEVIYGWYAVDPDADAETRLRAYELFDTPVTPTEGVPYLLVVQIRHRNCAE